MSPLTEIIKDEIAGSGPMKFDRFMELALYHPGYGYYTSGGARIGKERDYYTSPCVHPAFGETIARFLVKAAETLGGGEFTVAEPGAGRGLLASDILHSLRENAPGVYSRTSYVVIEKSPAAIREAETLLGGHRGRVRFAESLDALGAESVTGALLSNELMDALPFRRARFEGGRIREILVTLEDGRLIETTGDGPAPDIEEYFGWKDDFVEGQEVEVNLGSAECLEDIARVLKKGFALTIDYGYLRDELFGPDRMKGTYKCIYRHTVSEDPYIRIGEQDITAHVDFSLLVRAGEETGLREVKYTTQGQFLIDWGVLEILERESPAKKSKELREVKALSAIKGLFLPGSMGHSFRALLQAKGLGRELEGFYPESPLTISFGVT
ncbi:MAG TPA: SAM-dependent methyltransferase [Thermodesulfobacteriota bacterium]|nr:SAM-dependent methyltransferase [Thermodesulfobacteriota bacterium]